MTAIITDDPNKLPLKQILHASLILKLTDNGQLQIVKTRYTDQIDHNIEDLDHLNSLLK